MAKVQFFSTLSNLVGESFTRYASVLLQSIVQQVNGNLEFVQNIRASGPHSITVPAAGAVAVQHTLGRVPTGFIVVYIENSTVLIAVNDESTDRLWTDSVIYVGNIELADIDAVIYII